MAKVTGFPQVVAALKKKGKAAEGTVTCLVGFTTHYAIYVHENLEAHHPVGQAKYLEQPAREYGDELGRIVADAMAKGATIRQALMLAGLRLQREAQQLVPVKTGLLKNSAFTKVL